MLDSLTKFVVHLNDFEMFEVKIIDVLFVAGDLLTLSTLMILVEI